MRALHVIDSASQETCRGATEIVEHVALANSSHRQMPIGKGAPAARVVKGGRSRAGGRPWRRRWTTVRTAPAPSRQRTHRIIEECRMNATWNG
jgi:hypothetical protein